MLAHTISHPTVASLVLLVLFVDALEIDAQSVDPGPPGDVRKVVERGIGFLEREGAAWVKKQGCASCHHVPMMVWALHEARDRGHRVNETALAEIMSWALAEKDHAQVFPDLPLDKTRTEADYLGPLLMALALGADKDRDESVEKARHRLLDHAVSQQAEDGSWNANSGGRPPVHASQDVQTSWVFLALSDRAEEGRSAPWKIQREAAADWLSRNPPSDSSQAIAMRLLVSRRLGKAAKDVRPLVGALLHIQNEDGGWAQTMQMKSDAFATGLTMYALSGSRADGDGLDEAIARAQAFLVKEQQDDGSWPMSSRPAEPSGPGPARNLGPIKFVGTAWATIGLVRSIPGANAAKD
jgi:squalene-hopene/tetraprenyl-beta-curcumene cyclase